VNSAPSASRVERKGAEEKARIVDTFETHPRDLKGDVSPDGVQMISAYSRGL